jgi:hypothetical protein
MVPGCIILVTEALRSISTTTTVRWKEDLVDMQSRLDILKTRKSKEWNRYESQTWGQIITQWGISK